MDKLLSKRLPRDLRNNWGRYIALTFLIILGIFVIVSIVGAADTFIQRTAERKSVNMQEDGNFTVFIPLTDEELEKITADGTEIEKMFYSDISAEKDITLRMMKLREKIDLIQLDSGNLPVNENEVVIEKRYSEEHDLKIGDIISAGENVFTITGIGTVPDYDMPIKTYSDAVADSKHFGLIFVTAQTYDNIISEKSEIIQAEEYVYAFRLGNNTNAEKLRQNIEDLSFNYDEVGNIYFQETIDRILKDKYKIQDDLTALDDGAAELDDGIGDLDENSSELLDATDKLFTAYVENVDKSLNSKGVFLGLTKDNYKEKTDKFISDVRSGEISVVNKEDVISQIEEITDSLDAVKEFSDGITEYTDGVADCKDGSSELASGTHDLRNGINDVLDEIFELNLNNLTSFVKAEDNGRIEAAATDVKINKFAGLFAGIIILAMFTYVISVFVINQIENESGIIGTMYALGVKKKTLLKHYITIPVIVTFVGGIIGTAAGFSPVGVKNMMSDTYAYFSVPEFETYCPPYLIFYGIFLPPLICIIVNYLVINKKLSQTALSLIKNEQKASGGKQIRLKTDNFIHCFQIRQIIREFRSVLTVVFGVFISVILVELGLDIYVMCDAVKENNVNDTHYSYQYLYKYPDQGVPENGEEAYIETLSIDNMGTMLDVNIIGLNDDSRYFDAVLPEGKNKIAISNSVYERYKLHDGDTVTLTDSAKDTDYNFTVQGIVQYSPNFTVFMNIDSMRELFGQDEDYFNAVYSSEKLDIDPGRLYSVTEKKDIENASGIFVDRMMGMIILMIAVSVIIFCVVMYLMMNVMIDKSKFGISLVKIFGFRPSEVKKLYLNSNFWVVAAGTAICIPAGKVLVDAVYPMLISNIASSMQLQYPWYLYLIIYFGVLIVYSIISQILMNKIQKITPAEVLKNRD